MNITQLCDQILVAVNSVAVRGEHNMAQLMGIARAARAIKAEAASLTARQEEVENHGG